MVLSPEEVLQFLDCVDSTKHRAILTTCYAAGLRISEAVRLTPTAIDSQRMVIRVEQGKGQKDRYVMLSPKLLEILRDWWRVEKPKQWLFPGDIPGQHISTGRGGARMPEGPSTLGISKPITPHSLRHAFAVHLLEQAPMCAPSNCCLVIAAWPPRHDICGSPPAKYAPRPARSICSRSPSPLRPSPLYPSTSERPAPWIARSWKWRTSFAATAKPIGRTARCFAVHGAAARHERDRGVPDCRSRRSPGTVRSLRPPARLLSISCRNRHCPKCQSLARAQWIEDRQAELLDSEYFHVVFTLPEQIAAIAYQNKEVVYGILFRATAETLRTIAADPKHLGAEIGFFAVLHSWGQNLLFHPHLHCVVPGGGLSPDGTVGSPADLDSSCPCACSPACSAAYFLILAEGLRHRQAAILLLARDTP